MKILVFGPRDRYDVYRPPFADEMPVELVFRRPDQTYVQAAQENADARIIFVDAITDVGPDVMDQLPELKMIHSEGVGYNCIDCQAARERGIYVCNNKGCNAESVAEHTIMLMLMALRFGIPGHNAVIQGQQIQMKQKAIAAHAPEPVPVVRWGWWALETPPRPPPGGWPASAASCTTTPATAVRLRWRKTLG